MSGGKKHPLEIFKASGRSLGGQFPNAAAESSAESTPSPDTPAQGAPSMGAPKTVQASMDAAAQRRSAGSYPTRPFAEFELRLTLPAALILLFGWVILMGGAYIYGHSRGRDGLQEERDQSALALGRQIESGPAGPAPVRKPEGSTTASQPRPFGVLLVTYQGYQGDRRAEIDEHIKEISKLLLERYGITAPVRSWKHKNGMIEVFVGVFATNDNPELKQLEANLRRIKDWPSGRDKSPFQDSYPKLHPGIPSNATGATGATGASGASGD